MTDREKTVVRRCNKCIKSKPKCKRCRQLRSQKNPTSFNPTNPVVSSPFVLGSIFTSTPSNLSSDNSDPAYPSVCSNFQFQASSEIEIISACFSPKIINVKEEQDETKPVVHIDNLQLTLVSKLLKGIPQNPHFYQLRNYSKMVRKNLIFGWDRAFEDTVEGLQGLQVKDFWVRAKELWKTMEELQSLGYNVLLLRRRLVELTNVMMEMKVSANEILGLKNKAEFHRMEKSRLEFEILKLQSGVERQEGRVVGFLKMVVKMERELPKFDGVFAELTMKPL